MYEPENSTIIFNIWKKNMTSKSKLYTICVCRKFVKNFRSIYKIKNKFMKLHEYINLINIFGLLEPINI